MSVPATDSPRPGGIRPDVRTLAQQDPVPNLASRWGGAAARARSAVADLETCLRELDKVQDQLKERGLTVSTDLGPVGNAAQAARRDLDQPHTFQRGRAA